MKIIKRVFPRLSSVIKNINLNIRTKTKYSTGFDKHFWDTYIFLQKAQYWSYEKLEEYQTKQLHQLIEHIYKNVPYYSRLFNKLGITPSNIQTIKDLIKIPNMTKDEFRNNVDNLVAINMESEKVLWGQTSGTSGKSLQFYTSREIVQKELAFVFHQWSRAGFYPGDSRIEIRGAIINNDNRFEYDPIYNVLRLSPRIDNRQVAEYYLRTIQEFKSNFIYGYPSSIAYLAQIIRYYGLTVKFHPRAVLCASEVLYDWQREIISEIFSPKIFCHYGMAEQVIMAAYCEQSDLYHCVPFYGITEFATETNELIGTSFLNYINPFIRYRTTDIASGIKDHCTQCKRNYHPVFKEVEGRLGDYLITSRGKIGPGIMIHPFKNLKTIRDTQIIQCENDLILFKIACWKDKSLSLYQTEIEFLKKSLHSILGDDMKIKIEEVTEIERKPEQKYKWIVSDIQTKEIK
jgi:phenylacetate-CoA ligase